MNYALFTEYMNTHDLCCQSLGVKLVSIGEGTATATLALTDNCKNVMGGMHGGAIATLCDMAAGCSVCYRNRRCVTLESSIHYLKGIQAGSVTAIAKEIHSGKRISLCHVEVRNLDGELCCTASVTMYLTDTSIGDIIDANEREALELR